MILNNYKRILYGLKLWSGGNNASSISSNNSIFDVSNIYVLHTNGARSSYGFRTHVRNNNGTYYWYNPLCENWHVHVGDSNTPVTPDDYTLGHVMNEKVSNLTFSKSLSLDENCNSVITLTISGIAITSFNLKEVGVSVDIWDGSPSSNYPMNECYIIREVLDEPLALHSGQGFRIVLEIVENVTA